MDLSEAQEICKEWTPHIRWALQLQAWHINIEFETLKPNNSGPENRICKGQSHPDPRYRLATIYIDPTEHDDKDDLLWTLRHEIIHVALSAYQPLYWQIQDATTPSEYQILETQRQNAEEQTVWQIEQMLDYGLGFGVKGMVQRSKRYERERHL